MACMRNTSRYGSSRAMAIAKILPAASFFFKAASYVLLRDGCAAGAVVKAYQSFSLFEMLKIEILCYLTQPCQSLRIVPQG